MLEQVPPPLAGERVKEDGFLLCRHLLLQRADRRPGRIASQVDRLL